MHYRNGREAQNGDKVVMIDNAGHTMAFGVLYGATPTGGNACNGQLAPAQSIPNYACLCDCLHVDDLAAILAQAGLDKRPEGK